MSSGQTVGLTLGKFAPLHRGHQAVIEASLRETDHTIVLIYDMPELDIPPLGVRARWIRTLYPQVEVLEAWGGPKETGLSPEVTSRHDAYLQHRLRGKSVTHFFCSEPYGTHVARALNAVERQVDPARSSIPISATLIRKAPFAYREYLSPIVYRDLVTHVVLLGAPSSGKTTLAGRLASEWKTVWMPEYGREYWEQHQVERRLSPAQLLEIAVGHRAREDQLVVQANGYFFIDTDASTTMHFSNYYLDSADSRLLELVADTRDRYDLFFVCDIDIPYDDTWDRSGDANRTEMHRRVVEDLRARKVPFTLLSGSLDERVRKVNEVLQNFRK